MKRRLFFIDAEISFTEKKILDLGAVRDDGAVFHSPQKEAFCRFIAEADAICGHNIIHHDLKFLSDQVHDFANRCVIDTLYLSPESKRINPCRCPSVHRGPAALPHV